MQGESSMQIKIPLWSLDRTPNQHKNIVRNRYVVELDSGDLTFNVNHETLNPKMEWRDGYSWCTFGINTAERFSVWKHEVPDKTFIFGLLKRHEDYYDGPIITWELGPFYVNYRW